MVDVARECLRGKFTLREAESLLREIVMEQSLILHDGNMSEAAKALGIHRNTLLRDILACPKLRKARNDAREAAVWRKAKIRQMRKLARDGMPEKVPDEIVHEETGL